MTLYKELRAAGVATDNHYSDLYCEDTATAREIMRKHGARGSRFINQITGTMWIDIPFSFDPYWENVARKVAQA